MVLSKQAKDEGNTSGKATAGWIIGIISLVIYAIVILFYVLMFVIAVAQS